MADSVHEDSQQPPSSSASESNAASSPAHHDTTLDTTILSQSEPDTSLTEASKPDAEKHPKGRRKRTGAQDKTTLEEAYNNNPKPDKQARLAIVERVSLNEKEVQIWFQNRRQNDRRKSRPLTAQEIAALRPTGHHPGSDPVTSQSSFSFSAERAFPASDPVGPPSTGPAAEYIPGVSFSSPQVGITSRSDHAELAFGTPDAGSRGSVGSAAPLTTPQSQMPSSQESVASARSMPSVPSSVGYLANRWNLSRSFSASSTSLREAAERASSNVDVALQHAKSASLEGQLPSSQHSEAPEDTKAREEARMRLSMSLEGKAELVPRTPRHLRDGRLLVNAAPLPLPLPRNRALQRSQSATSGVELPPISSVTSTFPAPRPRLLRGRSSDVRAWESCAGPDVHDDLTDRAEAEVSGSAILEIAMARWPGQRRTQSPRLGPQKNGNNKRSSSMSNGAMPLGAKRSKLNRTTSSVARLEKSDACNEDKVSKDKMSVSMLCSGMDSDKENLTPDEDGEVSVTQGRRRPLPGAPPRAQQDSRRRKALQGPGWLSNRANTAPAGKTPTGKRGAASGENGGDDDRAATGEDPEVQKFMRGDVSPSKERDWHCVQSLLSLSGSRWERPR